MPRKKKTYAAVKIAEAGRIAGPKVRDGIFYALIIAVLVVFISGAYYHSVECTGACQGQTVSNGYPYPWFTYNTYGGWQSGSIYWIGIIMDLIFWTFIACAVMLVLYAAIKEI
jgi:hypothetical protein